LSVGLACLFAVGCGGSSNDDPKPPIGTAATQADLVTYCSSYCAKIVGCDPTKDQQTCASECQNVNGGSFTKVREDVIEEIESCESAMTNCSVILADPANNAEQTCTDEARGKITASAELASYCDAYVSAGAACGVTIDKDACVTDNEERSDAALTDAQSCTSKPCSEVPDCVNAALGS
jgi:hypothetical protein